MRQYCRIMSGRDNSSTLPSDWDLTEQETWRALGRHAQTWRVAGARVIVATGVFDLFHTEHQAFLERARQAGEYLIVGVESDARVRELKGPDRPYQPEAVRLAQLLAFPAVSMAAVLPVAFREPVHYHAWAQLMCPAVLAVSSHSPFLENKRAIMQAYGGDLQVVHPHNPHVSTTALIQQRTMESAE